MIYMDWIFAIFNQRDVIYIFIAYEHKVFLLAIQSIHSITSILYIQNHF